MAFPFKSITTVITNEHPEANDLSVEGTESVLSNSGGTATTDAVALATGPKKRFMLIDETKLPKEEAERLLVKRAYNRECAERARKRSKEMVQELHRQVEELQADKNELRRTLATMEKEIRTLTEMNKALTLNRLAQDADLYSQRNVGMCSETASPLNLYSPQQTLSTLSLLQQQTSCGDAIQPSIGGSFLPPWDYSKLLFYQQIRK